MIGSGNYIAVLLGKSSRGSFRRLQANTTKPPGQEVCKVDDAHLSSSKVLNGVRGGGNERRDLVPEKNQPEVVKLAAKNVEACDGNASGFGVRIEHSKRKELPTTHGEYN